MRKVHEMRKRDVTILFVSHAMADVKALGTLCAWLENGKVVELGRPDTVVPRYLGRMTQKDAEYLAKRVDFAAAEARDLLLAPEIVEGIPNIDHRHGNGAAEIIGIAALDDSGRRVEELQPSSTLVLRISVRAVRPVAAPNVGFMMRNHLGLDLAGANTAREGVELEPMQPGDITTVDFHIELPELYPGHFSFSPAVADGDYLAYEMADWIDNALALEMSHRGKPIYGYLHLPCRVEVNARLGKPAAAIES